MQCGFVILPVKGASKWLSCTVAWNHLGGCLVTPIASYSSRTASSTAASSKGASRGGNAGCISATSWLWATIGWFAPLTPSPTWVTFYSGISLSNKSPTNVTYSLMHTTRGWKASSTKITLWLMIIFCEGGWYNRYTLLFDAYLGKTLDGSITSLPMEMRRNKSIWRHPKTLKWAIKGFLSYHASNGVIDNALVGHLFVTSAAHITTSDQK